MTFYIGIILGLGIGLIFIGLFTMWIMIKITKDGINGKLLAIQKENLATQIDQRNALNDISKAVKSINFNTK